MQSRRVVLLAVCVAVLGLDPAPAPAQSLEEVVVTARKKEESLLDVPIAISAVTADALQKYNFSDFDDLQYVTPGLTFVESGNGIRNDRASFAYIFRGINVGASGAGSAAATLFIDGAPSLFGRLSSFANVERVEVLKGPQTAYFGRNTFTGAINVVTRTPGNQRQFRLSGELAQYGSSDVDVSFEGPLVTDKLSFRIAGRQLTKGGQYIDHSLGREIGGKQTKSFAGTLYYTPSERAKLKVFGEYAKFDDQLAPIFIYSTEFFNCAANGGATRNWICGEIPDTSVAAARTGAPGVFDSTFINAVQKFSLFRSRLKNDGGLAAINKTLHAIGDYELGNGMKLNAIAAWHDSRTQILYEGTHDAARANPFFPCTRPAGCAHSFGQVAFQIESHPRDFSVEARLSSRQDGRFRWTAGVNYIDAEEIPGVTAGEITSTPIQSFGSGPYATAKTTSAFGGVYFDLTERLTLNAEFRHQRDKVGRTPVDLAIGPGKPSQNPALQLEATFTANAPRFTLEYKPSASTMIYASWARGFRPGTFNPNILTLHPSVVSVLQASGATVDVDEEQLDQYELGLKGSGFGGRLRGSVVAYTGSLRNQQITQNFFFNRPDINFVSSVNVITNSGKTDIHGIELEGSALPFERLVLDGGFAWNYTKVVNDACATCVRLGGTLSSSIGKKMQNVPEYTGFLTGTYTWPLQGELEAYGRTEYFYQGKRYAERQNLAWTGDTNRVNLRTGVRTGAYSIEAYLLNAFDDDTVDGLSLENFFPQGLPGIKVGLPDRRQWGLRATYTW